MITIFEKFWTENELKIPKLKNHLTSIFKKIGFSVNYNCDTHYFYKNKDDILFYIRTSNSFISGDLLTINMLSKMDIIQFIPTYLKTINGLIVEHKKGYTQFEVEISDDVDINNIIKQITKKDFELKLKINKYNI
jgi:hypothetical protein